MQQPSPSSPRTDSYAKGYPWTASARLAQEIKAVCPAEGAQIGRWDNRASWVLDAFPEATEEQRDAARAVMATFDPWGDGSDIGALAEDEDPGEQDDLGAEMLAAEEEVLLEAAPLVDGVGDGHSESPANPGTSETEHYANDADRGSLAASEEPQHLAAESHPAADDGASYESDVDVVPGDAHVESYPGIAILPDELGARRNAVLAAIATEKLTRLSIAMDPSRADFLATRFADYQNAGALGLPIDEALAADYRAFQELRDRRDRITNYAMQLEQSALDGDMDRLEAMHAGLGDGWP